MRQHAGLAADRLQERSILTNDERHPLARQLSKSLRAERFVDLAVGIAQQRKPKAVLLVELLLPIHRIGANPHPRRIEFSKLRCKVTEVTAFPGSTRGHGFRVEEQHYGAGLDQVAEAHDRTALIEQFEIVDGVTFVHDHSSA